MKIEDIKDSSEKELVQKFKDRFKLQDTDFTINKKGIITKIKSDNPEAHYELGNKLSDKGLYKKAISAFKEAIKLNPNYAEAYNNLGFTYDETNNKLDAIVEYKKAIKANPKYSDAFFNLGLAYKDIEEYDEAKEALENFIKFAKEEDTKDVEHAHKLIIEIDKINISSEKEKNRRERAYYTPNDIKKIKSPEKIKKIPKRKITSRMPTFPDVQDYSIYEKYYSKKKEDQEREKNPEHHFNLGHECLNRRMYHEAIKHYKKAINLKPDYFDALHELGLAYHGDRWHKKAINVFRKAISKKPDNSLVHYHIGLTFSEMGKSKEAIKEFKFAIKLRPFNPLIYFSLGLEYEHIRDLNNCKNAYREFVRYPSSQYRDLIEHALEVLRLLSKKGGIYREYIDFKL